jgi:uncharacterized protein with gpF-like domain
MKRIFTFLAFALILTGCSIGEDMDNTPTKQVEAYLNNYQTLDSNVLAKLDAVVENEEMFDEDQKVTYRDILKKHYQDLTYTIKEETVNGDKATVEAEIEVNDYTKAIKEAEKKGKETAKLKDKLEEQQKNAYQNAPQLDVEIDNIELFEKSKKIAQDYTYNMKYWVKKWEAKNIIEMRKDVLKMVQQGARYERIQEYFEKRWKIAKNKAYFLAKNESDLAGSVIKATDYQELGCPGYVWGRSSAREKRELHKQYYGKFFTWEDKPIIDEKLGIRGYPRQIWNCSCHMLIKPPTMSDIIQKHTEVRNAKRNIFTKIKYAITNGKQCYNNAWRYRRFGEGQTL